MFITVRGSISNERFYDDSRYDGVTIIIIIIFIISRLLIVTDRAGEREKENRNGHKCSGVYYEQQLPYTENRN